jgi:hypothetical protein
MKTLSLTYSLPLLALCPAAFAQTTVYLDGDTPATGSLLQTQQLLTPLGTIDFVGEVWAVSDGDMLTAGAAGNGFDIVGANRDATMTFGFDVTSVTFLYGGNIGQITVEARDAAGNVLDVFFQADTGTGQPAGPETLMGVGIRSLYWADPSGNYAILDNITIDTAGAGIGTTYCNPAVLNSTGVAGELGATGSASVAANDVTLRATSLPPSSFGFFLTSRTAGFVAGPGGSQGNLCLSGSIGRFVGPGQIQNSGASGTFSLAIDLTSLPQPAGAVAAVAGETWRFQAWHRDAVSGVPTSNFTNGLELTFQ